jgi:hypothetical protein
MITILHGEDQVNSRRELEKIISSFKGEVVRLEKDFNLTDLYQKISHSLFGKTLVVIENYLSGRRKIEIEAGDADIIFWEPKEVPKAVIGANKAIEFKVPSLIWKFCDALKPTNGKYLVPLFRETLKTADAEFIFAMIVRQFRLMLSPDGLPSWQLGKIQSQAKVFGGEHLKLIYNKLLTIDYDLKSGRTPFTLEQNIEKLLLWI